jgi:hypothetical protein
MPWSRPFDDPIVAEGEVLETLEDAADYIQALPRKTYELRHWQVAMGCLIAAAEDLDFVMHARIAMLRALNHGKPRPERVKQTKVMRIIGRE